MQYCKCTYIILALVATATSDALLVSPVSPYIQANIAQNFWVWPSPPPGTLTKNPKIYIKKSASHILTDCDVMNVIFLTF